jgi:dephospho-CoA kinase
VRRLMKRDDIDETLARAMLAHQMSNEQRIARAHDIIDNRSDKADLRTQVDALHRSYLSMAANR